MSEQNYEEMYKKLERLHESTHKSVLELQRENCVLQETILLLQQKLINCQSALDINKDIMRNALTRQNELTVTHNEEIQILRDKIKWLEELKKD